MLYGTIASAVLAPYTKEGSRPLAPTDFFPDQHATRKKTAKQQRSALREWADACNAVAARSTP